MNKTYYVCLDLESRVLNEKVVKDLLSPSLIERICIIESASAVTCLTDHVFDLIIFDHDIPEKEVKSYCQARLDHSPHTVFIHLSNTDPVRCDALHLVGVSIDLFDEYFIHLIGLCFLTYTIRESLEDIREIIHYPGRL